MLPIIFGHLLNNLPCLFDITPVMGFTTVGLDGIGPSSRCFDDAFSAGAQVWGCSDQLLPQSKGRHDSLPSPSVAGIV